MTNASAALRAGLPVVLPTDTVYGLCGDPDRPEVAQEVARLKGRDQRQDGAVVTQ